MAAFAAGALFVAVRGGLTTTVTVVTEPTPAVVTVPVERRALEDTIVTRGNIVKTDVVSISWPSLNVPRPVVTSLEAALGDQVDEGQVVASVSGRPVIVLRGAFPMFRELVPGVKGVDVVQLQESLTRLGLYDGEIDGSFGWSTQRAVRDLYRENSYEPSRFVAIATPGENAEGAGSIQPTVTTGIQVPLDELVFVPELPADVVATHVKVGAIPAPAGPLLDLSAGEVLVTTALPAWQIETIEVGTRATIIDEVTATSLTAEVVAIAAEPEPGSEVLEREVRLRPLESAGHLVGTNVRVTFTLAATEGPVMAVPITAVWTSGETRFVTVSETGTHRDVAVETGLVVGGWVEIRDTDGALAEGDQVVVTR